MKGARLAWGLEYVNRRFSTAVSAMEELKMAAEAAEYVAEEVYAGVAPLRGMFNEWGLGLCAGLGELCYSYEDLLMSINRFKEYPGVMKALGELESRLRRLSEKLGEVQGKAVGEGLLEELEGFEKGLRELMEAIGNVVFEALWLRYSADLAYRSARVIEGKLKKAEGGKFLPYTPKLLEAVSGVAGLAGELRDMLDELLRAVFDIVHNLTCVLVGIYMIAGIGVPPGRRA